MRTLLLLLLLVFFLHLSNAANYQLDATVLLSQYFQIPLSGYTNVRGLNA